MPYRQVAVPVLVPGHSLRIVGADPRHSPNPFAGGHLYFLELVRTNGEVIYLAATVNIEYAYVPVQEQAAGQEQQDQRLQPRAQRRQ